MPDRDGQLGGPRGQEVPHGRDLLRPADQIFEVQVSQAQRDV